MPTIRRVYLYLILAASLGTLSSGVILLLRSLLDVVFQTQPDSDALASQLLNAGALLIVGLPIWAGHWWYTTHLIRQDPEERTATLRRLYLYAVLVAAVITATMPGAYVALRSLIDWLIFPTGSLYRCFQALPLILVGGAIWLYHWRLAGQERAAAGETGGSATLRRWYVYGVSAGALLFLVHSTARLIELLWRQALAPGSADLVNVVAAPVAAAPIALGVWVFHWRWSNQSATAEDDRRSVLRTVYLLTVLGAAVAVTLTQVSQVLYYALSRLLGVERPGGVNEPLPLLLGGPVAFGIVYAIAWIYHRRILTHETAAYPDSPRRLGVRRLYRYLVALVSIAVFAIGFAQLLWTLGDLLTAQLQPDPDWWRRQISLGATLTVVGLLTWLGHWRPVVDAEEARSLSRRIYVYLTLLGAVLAGLFAGVSAVYRALELVLGVQSATETVVDLTRSLGTVITAGGIAYYHWRALRHDQQAAATQAPPEPAPEAAPTATLVLTDADGRVLRRIAGDRAVLEQAFDRIAGSPPAASDS